MKARIGGAEEGKSNNSYKLKCTVARIADLGTVREEVGNQQTFPVHSTSLQAEAGWTAL